MFVSKAFRRLLAIGLKEKLMSHIIKILELTYSVDFLDIG